MDWQKVEKQDYKKSYQLHKLHSFGSLKMGYGKSLCECQDSYCIMEGFNGTWNFFSVYDGHGSAGKEASQAANDYIQTYLERNSIEKIRFPKDVSLVKQFINQMYGYANDKLGDSGIDYSISGTCALGALIINNYCFVSNLGDSRAVLCRQTENQTFAIELSRDQRVTQPQEKARILREGGKIGQRIDAQGIKFGKNVMWNDQGYGLEVGRSLGDFSLNGFGLSQQPDITHIELTDSDKFLIVATDGLWDVMSSDEACHFIKNSQSDDNLSDQLITECRQRQDIKAQNLNPRLFEIQADDVSVIVINFSIELKKL